MAVIADNSTTTPVTDSPGNTSDASAPAAQVSYVMINGTNLTTPLQAVTTCDQTGCAITAYTVTGAGTMNTTGYNCSVTDNGKVYLTCDSIYDGNGDGICTSGESCIQFGIVGTYITRKERNSQDQWVDHDDSFFLPRVGVQP